MPTALEAIKPLDDVMKLYVRPSWADARLILAQNEWTFQIFTLPIATNQMFLPANPRRWALWFVVDVIVPDEFHLSPAPDGTEHGVVINNTTRMNPLTLFDFGPLVQSEWYGHSLMGGTLGVYETSMS